MLSDPPCCAQHIDAPDAWYDLYWREAVDAESSLIRRHLVGLLGARLYQDALEYDPVFASLSTEFRGRYGLGQILEPAACFAIGAAALGLNANCTYQPLSIHVRRFAAPTSPQAIEIFDEFAPRVRYEQLRLERNGLSLGKLSCPGELLLALYSRARLLLDPARMAPSLQEINASLLGTKP